MATSYPTSKQTFTNPQTTDVLDSPSHAGLHTDINDTVEALETALGTTTNPREHSATAKTTPVDADEIGLIDSASSNVLKKLTWANLKATIKSYYDSVTATLTNKTIDADNNTISNLVIGAEVSDETTGNFHIGGSGLYFQSNNNRHIWFRTAAGGNRALLYYDYSASKIILRRYGGVDYDLEMRVGGFRLENDVNITGSLSKGSGSFRIDHPLKPLTHELVHSFVESPQADNIYSGMVTLKNGKATVNIDEVSGMTEGTFKALNRDIRRMTTNESGFTAIKSKIEGNILIIEAEDSVDDEVFWQVIGERQDKHMFNAIWTDENGKVIVEPEKEELDPKESEDIEEEVSTAEEAGEEEDKVKVNGKKGYYIYPSAYGVKQEVKRKVRKVFKKKK